MSETSAFENALTTFVESFTEIFPNITAGRLLAALGIIILVVILLIAVRQLMRLLVNALDKRGKISKRFKNQFRIAYNIIRIILVIVAVLTIMQVFGINVSAIVAGLGIASVIVGFVLQETLRDIVMSIRIVVDNYFTVGDVIRYGDIEAEVISMSSQTTTLRDLSNDNIIAVGNHNFTQVAKVSENHDIDVGLSYEDDPGRIVEVLTDACARIAKLDKVKGCELKGLQSFGSHAVVYRIRLHSRPQDRRELVRSANKVIRETLIEAGLTIPYDQLDVHITPAPAE